MFTLAFWRDVLERAIKTAAQSAIVGAGFTSVTANALTFDWVALGGFAAGGFILSVLSSVGSYAFTGSASAVKPAADAVEDESSDESVEADAAPESDAL